MLEPRGNQFLPLTSGAAARAGAGVVLLRAQEADIAAGACWTALIAGCADAGRWGLAPRLRQLSEATSEYVGTRWWSVEGVSHRNRVAGAQCQIEDAIAEGDGQEFAKAFSDYDNAMASAVVCGGRHRAEKQAQ
ncbi:hypothetical protein [Amycolatopsis albispora]|uniref:Uncharacterized protein n=1 Tax=Amycolatopsis albispora TaxID=1804986 RepID=A0A344LAM2_9PSEU|nr:hypothetical protein [Amycolatopsis albispora]AXB45096.1 hypothetical protein A4R43_23500 [Amycolatopsis albispora]